MEYFLHVADVGSITMAARDLGIAQPALSRHIRRLEVEIGAEMFHRLPQGVQLTEAGRQFHERCRRIMHEFALAKQDISGRRGSLHGNVAFGLPDTLAALLAPSLVRRLRVEAPNISLRIVEGDGPFLTEALLAGRLQAAILPAPVNTPMLDVLPLGPEAIAVFDARNLQDAREYYTLAEICNLPLMMTTALRRFVEAQISGFGKRLNVQVEVDSISAIRRMVVAGMGPSILPVATLREEVESGVVRAFPISGIELKRVLAIVQPKGAPAPAPALVVRIARDEMALPRNEGALTMIPGQQRPLDYPGAAEPRLGSRASMRVREETSCA